MVEQADSRSEAETLRLSDIREGVQTRSVPPGVSRAGHNSDVTAVNSETLRDNDMKTDQSEEMSQGSQDSDR